MNQPSEKSSTNGVIELRDPHSGELLHIAYRPKVGGRVNLCGNDEPLQVASIVESAGKSYPAHKHLLAHRVTTTETQECWIVVRGCVHVTYYDLADNPIGDTMLYAGDCSLTLRGGHAYEIVDDALVYEFKTGPYVGREQDKVAI